MGLLSKAVGLAGSIFGGGGGIGGQTQSSSGSSFVDPAQQPFLDALRQQGLGVQQGQQAGLEQFASQGLGGLFQQGLQLNQGLGGINQQLGGVFNNLGGFSNQQQLQGNINNLSQNLGQFFNEQLLPGIDATTQLAGQGIGSGRNAVARGQATRDIAQAFGQGVVGLQGQANQQQLQAAGLQGQVGGLQGGLLQNQIGNLGGLGVLGLSQFTAPFAGLSEFGGLLGAPTVLSQQKSSGVGGDVAFRPAGAAGGILGLLGLG